ncbi:MAG: DHH family phosphoesterase [Candidatus Aenigmarchaeota archaeon]|nr:DHH family phosphoesterase [Candidatus Aenigmarchaeota archaeon]
MKAEEFLKKTHGKTAIFFHNDADGVCSAAIVLKYVKEADLFSGDVNEEIFENLGADYERIIFVDYAVDQFIDYFQKLKGRKVIVIDHHPIANDLNKLGFVHINPRFEKPKEYISCSQVVYEICNNLGVKDTEWIMRIGATGDAAIKGTKKEKDAAKIIEAFKAFKKAKRLPEIVRFMLTCDNIDDFIYSEYLDYKEKLDKEVENEVIRFEMQGVKDINFYDVKSKYGILAVVSNTLFEKYPNKIIILYKEKDGWYKFSGRSAKHDIGSVFKKASEGIGYGGGHPKAGGAYINNFELFKKRVLELLHSG